MTFSPELSWRAARDRIDQFHREAESRRRSGRLLWEKRASQARAARQREVTIRLDRAGDASRLYQLAALSRKRLAAGPFVVADLGGRIVAARPVAGGPPVSDPSEATAELHALLELRAAQLAAG